MMQRDPEDPSAGYNAVAPEFMRCRDPAIGAATVRAWARELPPGGVVLDLGCGHGVPIAQLLIESGCEVYGVDGAPALVAAFRQRFPQARVECAAVERSTFFGRMFDGAVAWGLLFLLPADAQIALIHRVAAVLVTGGRFLFTAPEQACQWTDVLTGHPSLSLGGNAYRAALSAAGLALIGESEDEGGNHYYLARRV